MRRDDTCKTDHSEPEPAEQAGPPSGAGGFFGAIRRGFRAWLNLAPGCSACNDPFTRANQQDQRARTVEQSADRSDAEPRKGE